MKSLLILLSLTLLTPCFSGIKNPVKIKMETNYGDIILELNQKKAPQTVKNFLKYTKNNFYNGTIFHRVIDGFMVQGGGLTETMQKKQTLPAIKNEADNGLENDIGTIAMARTGDVNSATSQFFINVNNNTSLNHKGKSPRDYGYTVFGKVIKGMTVINRIKKTTTSSKNGRRDVPVNPVVIKKVTRL